jgi:integrase
MTKDVAGRGIYLRGSVYWLTWYQAGKKCFASLETSDYPEAITRARDIRIRPTLMAAGGFIEEIGRFLAYKLRRNEFSKATANARFYILRHFAKWVDVPVCNVTAAQVQAFYDWKLDSFGAQTANDYAMILRSFFNWAVNIANVCRRNPLDELDPAETETRGLRLKDFCTEEQRDRLIKTCLREDLAFVLYAGFHAGLRKNEIIEAVPWWFDLNSGMLHLRATPTIKFKDREERSIPLTKQFTVFLREYGLREPYMLSPNTKHGKNRYRYDFSKPFFAHS